MSINIQIGSEVSPVRAARIAIQLEMFDTASKILNNIHDLKPFVFDGCSGVPDFIEKIPKIKRISFIPCLKHDLRYYIGTLGDEAERLSVDLDFRSEILHGCQMEKIEHPKKVADFVFSTVRNFGCTEYGKPYSWGFGWKEQPK